MSKKEERQIEEKVFRQTVQDEIEKVINPPEENEAPIILTAKERQKAEIARQNEIARVKNANKIAKKRQMEEEYMGAVASKRNAKARKIAHHRQGKNFGWWFFGFVSFILVIAIAVGVVFAVIPVKTYFGDKSSKYVNDDIAESTPLKIVQNITTYKAGDIPAIELLFDTILNDYGLNKYISVDIDKINDATLVSSEFTTALTSSIKIIATLRSLGVADSMGDLGNTPAFKDFEVVSTEKLPDFEHDDFNKKLYYYMLADGSYARAFEDNGDRIADSNGKDLYLPALVDVMLLDLPAVLADRLETMKVKSLLSCFGMGEDNTFTKIIGERTIGDMKYFDINTVKIADVLPVESATLKDSLVDMTYQSVVDSLITKDETIKKYLEINADKTEEDWEALSIDDKQAFVISEIYPSIDETIMDEQTQKEQKQSQFELITIGDLSNADMNKIRLMSVMPKTTQNEMMYDILVDMSGKEKDKLTVGDMATADVTQIKITSVMHKTSSNKKLFSILEDMTKNNVLNSMALEKYLALDSENNTEDTWNNLSEDDKALYLFEARKDFDNLTEDEKHDLIRVVHLGNGDVTHIRLLSVLDYTGNEKLYDVLRDLASENVIEQYIFDNYEGISRESWQGKPDSEIMANGRTKGELWQEASARYYGLDNYVNDKYADLSVAEREDKKKEIINNYIKYKFDEDNYDNLTIEQKLDVTNFFAGFDKDGKNNLITIASLDKGDISLIKLTNVLTPTADNEKLYDILRDMTGEEKNDDIKVSDLKNAKVDDIKLISVVTPTEDNKKLYTILRDMTGKTSNDDIKLSDLKVVNVDNIKLTSVLPVSTSNEKLYDILRDMTGETTNDDIKVSSLNNVEIGNIKLTSVLPVSTSNEKLYTILRDMTHKNNNADIIVSDLENADIEHIKLLNVLPMGEENKNAKLYDVLRDLSRENVINQYIFDTYGISREEWKSASEGTVLKDGKTKGQIREEATNVYNDLENDEKNELITVASLDGGDITAIKLTSVLPISGNEKLYTILTDMTNKTAVEITAYDLSNTQIEKIKLKSVMGTEPSNKILAKLWQDDTVTVGNMSEKVNNLSIVDLFNQEVFTIDLDKAVDGARYTQTTTLEGKKVYTFDNSGIYCISNKASIWLSVSYDCNEINGDGYGVTYVESSTTLKDMQD
ncbi:MAG: hypothetical protein KBS91_01440, partial [Firmicutes bacterium]|nr:hypothetical protein [Candidatus Caballimonas caccae]